MKKGTAVRRTFFVRNYDRFFTYWAAHLGVGKVFSVGGNNKLDGYLKYKKNNVTVDLGMNGWIGKQRGLSAQLGATWTF